MEVFKYVVPHFIFLGGIVYMDLKEIELIIQRIDEIREQLKEEIKHELL